MLTPYQGLTPDLVLTAVAELGLEPDGRLLELNSYENRVYQIGIEDSQPLVAKFYRPGRWSDAAILEEHAFSQELADDEVPVVAPLRVARRTLHACGGFRYAVYPRRGGRAPELDRIDVLERIGRFLGRLHAVGARSAFRHRAAISIEQLGEEAVATILAMDLIPEHLQAAYRTTVTDLLRRVRTVWQRAGSPAWIRLHGDCHPGNILWTDDGPHFVDLDDAVSGPTVQDLWMLLSGDRVDMTLQLDAVLAGYEDFRDFDRRELHLIEPLRTLRMLHHSAWLARRWDDPAFPRAFPWFGQNRYWEEQVLALREQAALLDEPPLHV
jgi:Ser/Thr protein kinase RdoA (MazF antagonist)